MYPGLAEYMGLELSDNVIRQNMPEYLEQNRTTAMIQLPQVMIFSRKNRQIQFHEKKREKLKFAKKKIVIFNFTRKWEKLEFSKMASKIQSLILRT